MMNMIWKTLWRGILVINFLLFMALIGKLGYMAELGGKYVEVHQKYVHVLEKRCVR